MAIPWWTIVSYKIDWHGGLSHFWWWCRKFLHFATRIIQKATFFELGDATQVFHGESNLLTWQTHWLDHFGWIHHVVRHPGKLHFGRMFATTSRKWCATGGHLQEVRLRKPSRFPQFSSCFSLKLNLLIHPMDWAPRRNRGSWMQNGLPSLGQDLSHNHNVTHVLFLRFLGSRDFPLVQLWNNIDLFMDLLYMYPSPVYHLLVHLDSYRQLVENWSIVVWHKDIWDGICFEYPQLICEVDI